MSDEKQSNRLQVIRDMIVLQVKLLVDGARDAILIPVSFLAALLGVIRGGNEPDREFKRVLKWGRRSERWINLFGHQSPLGRSHPAGSLDVMLDRVEEVVVDQYRKGKNPEEARAAINAAMEEATEDGPQQKEG
jgi:hypothetical protein